MMSESRLARGIDEKKHMILVECEPPFGFYIPLRITNTSATCIICMQDVSRYIYCAIRIYLRRIWTTSAVYVLHNNELHDCR